MLAIHASQLWVGDAGMLFEIVTDTLWSLEFQHPCGLYEDTHFMTLLALVYNKHPTIHRFPKNFLLHPDAPFLFQLYLATGKVTLVSLVSSTSKLSGQSQTHSNSESASRVLGLQAFLTMPHLVPLFLDNSIVIHLIKILHHSMFSFREANQFSLLSKMLLCYE